MPDARRVCAAAFAVLFLALAACGGGGDDTPTLAPHALPTGAYLPRFNEFRSWANLPAVVNNPALQIGGDLHCQWMVLNDTVTHTEIPGTPGYSIAGHLAGQASNIAGQTPTPATVREPLAAWMTAPFHGIAMVDPRLTGTAFSHFADNTQQYPSISYGAALNVASDRTAAPPATAVMWPADGKVVDLLTYGGFEVPDPVVAYGLTPPTGLPVYLQLPPGATYPPTSTTSTFSVTGGALLAHTTFDGGNFLNPTPADQDLGRAVLATRRAIVLIPHATLAPGTPYSVSITASGVAYAWSFSTHAGATKPSADSVVPLTRLR